MLSEEVLQKIRNAVDLKQQSDELKKDFPGETEDEIDWIAAFNRELNKKYVPSTLVELANDMQDTPNYYSVKGIEEFKKEIPVFDNYVDAFEFVTKLALEKGVTLDD